VLLEVPENADEATRSQYGFLFGGVIYDLGGTLLGGRVHAGAGAEAGRELGVAEIERLAQRLFRPTRQRTTVYGEPTPERKAARG
jgi:2-iminoacetate synthase ThiH